MRRLPTGGRIDRSRTLRFTWNGATLTGHPGDTLASALMAAGVDVIGTSVSLGRPRGVMSAGLEEATGFAQVHSGAATEPLVRMTGIPVYEGLVAEGLITKGRLSHALDDARFDKRYAHCDVLVVGGGPAGLQAALDATRRGERVILCEADTELGGALLRDSTTIDRMAGVAWAAAAAATLGTAPDTMVLTATTAAMQMDQNGMILAQKVGALRSPAERGTLPEQRLWHVRAKRIVIATGALERWIVFPDNDRPGILLASAARSYLHRQALAPSRGVVFTTNDDAYRTALDWHAFGVTVAAIVDTRPPGSGALRVQARALGIPVFDAAAVVGTLGDDAGRVRAVLVRSASGTEEVACDTLAVSGGHEPNLNLHQQVRGATRFDERIGAAVPARPLPGQEIIGAAAGEWDTSGEDAPGRTWRIPAPDGDETRSFIDLHRDATVAGVTRAVAAGARHIEHVKRFTLVGTGVEQGREAKTNAGILTAELTARDAAEVGLAGSRPPYEPLAFHLMAGRATGERYEPVRTTSLHARHVAAGAVFEPAGQWLRPSRYPRDGESVEAAVRRECRAVRTGVGIMDASTLGKIDVRGPDAAWFLDRLYVNNILAIPLGRARYSVMCHMDGSVLDDGLVMRTGEQQFFVTTSTGHAAAVVDWMEEWLQTEWPTKRVWVTPITEQWATIAIAGPRARDAMAHVAPGLEVTNEAFPFLAVRRAAVARIADAQVARVSFSGELAYEVSVPWHEAPRLWDALLAADRDVTPYGLDALQCLRMEKGYIIVGQDTESLTTPEDAGLGWMVSKSKDYVGRRSNQRPAPRRADRAQLVGFTSNDPSIVVPEGTGLVTTLGTPPMRIEGHVTSSCWSDALQRSIGLALVRGGRARHGDVLRAPLLDGRVASVTLTDPVHYDKAGTRRDG